MSNKLQTELRIQAKIEGAEKVDGLNESLKDSKNKSDKFKESAEKNIGVLERMRSTALKVGAALGIAFAVRKVSGFFAGAISGAADFEQQLATVKSVSDDAAESIDRIKDKAEEMGRTTRYTATEAAQGFEVLVRAGLTVNQAIESISSVLALAAGNGLELADAAEYVISAVKGMGLEFDQTGRVADVLSKAAASAKTNVEGMGAALSYAAPSAFDLGLSIEETAAYIGQFANAGIDASRAGTSFNSMLSQFKSGSSTFRKELNKAGITTKDFNKAIHQLAAAGPRGEAAIDALGTEAGPALKALLSQGMGSLDEFIEKLNSVEGAAQKQSDTINNTWRGALASLGSAWDGLKNKLGESFLEPMTRGFKDLAKEITSLVDSGKIKEIGENLAEMFSAATDKLLEFIKAFNFKAEADAASESFEKVSKVLHALNGAFQALNIAFQGLKSGLALIAAGVASFAGVALSGVEKLVEGMAAASSAIGNNSFAEKLRQEAAEIKEIRDGLSEFVGAMAETIESSGESIKKSAQSIAGTAEQTANQVQDSLKEIPEGYTQALYEAKQVTDKLFSEIVANARANSQDLVKQFADIRNGVEEAMSGFDSPEQFAALIASIVDAGMEAKVGAELMQKLGEGAAKGAEVAEKAAEQTKNAIKTIADQASETKTAIEAEFGNLNIDFSKSLTGISSDFNTKLESISRAVENVGNSSYTTQQKTKLLSALLETGLGAAQTKEEFDALNETIKQTGLTNYATKEQIDVLKVGLQGGSEAVKKNKEALDKKAESLDKVNEKTQENTEKTEKNTEKTKDNADAQSESAAAVDKDTEAKEENKQVTMSLVNSAGLHADALAHINAKMQEVTNAANKAMASGSYSASVQANKLNEQARALEETTRRTIAATAELNAKVSDGTVTMRDIARAASSARTAMGSLDKTTLNNLNAAIDAAYQKMANMRLEAEDTRDAIDAQIAALDGDDSKTAKLQQERKLRELNLKLQEAELANNSAAVAKWREAISLQKELYNKQRQKAQAQKREREQQEKERQKQERQREQQRQPTQSSTPSTPSTTPSATNDMYAGDVVDAFQERIEAAKRHAKEEGKQEAKQELADEMIRAAKSRPF